MALRKKIRLVFLVASLTKSLMSKCRSILLPLCFNRKLLERSPNFLILQLQINGSELCEPANVHLFFLFNKVKQVAAVKKELLAKVI